ncbi:site-specific DNA-methyltransferase [uncultured Fibrobacter sp.]|uniref:site-specific DNA-methyltransferase n=1 Tax=uncultured Fibrobacter sp. TaxID=261512 RepID=UPI0025D0CA02|nr:site-specific DNA-methyltransferase [uncultured Fibrobacter sp.]
MEKANMHSLDMVNENIKKIGNLFPECVTETVDENGNVKAAIDFEKLQENLSHATIGEGEERYQFTWPGKREAIHNANAPTNMTLRPCKAESVDFDNTENLYIEGDNLEVLKLLQENYLGKVKMIYIDPPYNTGNDFVYNDDFKEDMESFQSKSGMYDEDGNMLLQNFEKNTESNGRFHTDWLNMMYPRLKIARNLLSDDGVIFISIDDNEIENLRKIGDEIFGGLNFVAQFIWRGGRRNLAKYVSTSHEYMLCFAKDLNTISEKNISWKEPKKGLNEIYSKVDELTKIYGNDYSKASSELKKWYKKLPDDNPSKDHEHYCNIDAKGVYFASDISRGGGGGPQWEIVNPITGNVVQTPSRGWSYAKKEDLLHDIELGLIHFNGDGVPCKKRYLKENETQVFETVFYKDRRGSSKRLRKLMGGDFFPFPKDEEVLFHFLESFSDKKGIILDFFSGSATTAHAVMQLNAEDGGKRKFICVQLPEATAEDSEAYKAGYKNICEIGKERIRRAGKKIVAESSGPSTGSGALDIGFRVLKLADSNMKDVYYSPAETDSADIFDVNNVKEDRTPLDLLFQVMPECNLPLSSKIEERTIEGKTVYFVNGNYLVACFDEGITEKLIKAVIDVSDSEKPYYFYMRNLGLESDKVLDNFEQLFVHYSPTTKRKVI